VNESGQPFWLPPKRAPDALIFDAKNVRFWVFVALCWLTFNDKPVHLDYIIAASNLHAFNYGLHGNADLSLYAKVASAVPVPEFVPKSNVKVQITDNDPPPAADDAG
jgi:ubiquitin-activating enzyme E1